MDSTDDDDEVTGVVTTIQNLLSSYAPDTQLAVVTLLSSLALPEKPTSGGCQGCIKKLNIYF